MAYKSSLLAEAARRPRTVRSVAISVTIVSLHAPLGDDSYEIFATSSWEAGEKKSPPPPVFDDFSAVWTRPEPPKDKGKTSTWAHVTPFGRTCMLHLSPGFTVAEHPLGGEAIRAALRDLRRPAFHASVVDFPTEYARNASTESIHALMRLISPQSERLYTEPNAGGSSVESEAVSFDVVAATFGGHTRLIATEMEVTYFPKHSKKTDYLMSIDGHHLGVSVTRAFAFRGTFTLQQAVHLLRRKLAGVNDSTGCIFGPTRVERQILHVWTPDSANVATLKEAWRRLRAYERANTLVVVSVCNVSWLYTRASAFTKNGAM